MKKLISILLIGLLIISGFGVSAAPLIKRNINSHITDQTYSGEKNGNTSIYEDHVDQNQTSYDGVIPVGAYFDGDNHLNVSVAQSFIPTKKILTRVQFFMARNATVSYPCTLAIRDNLTGDNLAVVNVTSSIFPAYTNLSWIDFNFEDIPVNIGTKYYMILYTTNVTGNFYYCAGMEGSLYSNGSAYISFNNGQNWTEISEGDGCFKTYGRNAPAWAKGLYSGQWGISIFGLPVLPIGWFTGFSKQGFILVSFEGIFANFNVTIRNATGGLNGVILGPFILGGVRNLTTGNGTFFVGLGGRNATTSEFYFRIMVFFGPNFYMYGKYYDL